MTKATPSISDVEHNHSSSLKVTNDDDEAVSLLWAEMDTDDDVIDRAPGHARKELLSGGCGFTALLLLVAAVFMAQMLAFLFPHSKHTPAISPSIPSQEQIHPLQQPTPAPLPLISPQQGPSTADNDTDAPSEVLHSNNQTIAYAYARTDRSGSQIQELLYDHAYCYSQGWHFGGVCGQNRHQDTVEYLLKGVGLDQELPFACPMNKAINANVVMLDKDEIKYQFEHLPRLDEWKMELRSLMQERLRDNPQSPWRPRDNNDTFHVTAHVRRGDVAPCNNHAKGRYLSNLYYLLNIDSVVGMAAENQTVHVTIFSESPKEGIENMQYESFDDFVERGYTVVLDGDVRQAWDAMIRSDVLIISQSSFSIIPAFFKFDQGLVIHGKLLHQFPAQPTWVHTDRDIRQQATAQTKAIQRKHCPK